MFSIILSIQALLFASLMIEEWGHQSVVLVLLILIMLSHFPFDSSMGKIQIFFLGHPFEPWKTQQLTFWATHLSAHSSISNSLGQHNHYILNYDTRDFRNALEFRWYLHFIYRPRRNLIFQDGQIIWDIKKWTNKMGWENLIYGGAMNKVYGTQSRASKSVLDDLEYKQSINSAFQMCLERNNRLFLIWINQKSFGQPRLCGALNKALSESQIGYIIKIFPCVPHVTSPDFLKEATFLPITENLCALLNSHRSPMALNLTI